MSFFHYLICGFLSPIWELLKNDTFWNAVGALGTVGTLCFSLYLLKRELDKGNVKNWLELKKYNFAYKDDRIALLMNLRNNGYSEIKIKGLQIFVKYKSGLELFLFGIEKEAVIKQFEDKILFFYPKLDPVLILNKNDDVVKSLNLAIKESATIDFVIDTNIGDLDYSVKAGKSKDLLNMLVYLLKNKEKDK